MNANGSERASAFGFIVSFAVVFALLAILSLVKFYHLLNEGLRNYARHGEELRGRWRLEKAMEAAARIAQLPTAGLHELKFVPGAGDVDAARAAVVEKYEVWRLEASAAYLEVTKSTLDEETRRLELDHLMEKWPKTPAAEEAAEILKRPPRS